MRTLIVSMVAACYLYGADPQNVLSEVVKLREKYEECRQQQLSNATADQSSKIKGYQKRISILELQLEQSNKELSRLKKSSNDLEREINQKKGVISSLEKTLNARDKGYREAVADNERLLAQTNSAKVSRIERQNLTSSLEKAKFEVERLESVVSKLSKEKIALERELSTAKGQIDKFKHMPPPPQVASKPLETPKLTISSDQNGKIKALQSELARANAYIQKLQSASTQPIAEKIVEKVVYKDRIVEPTEKIVSLQKELSAAQATIANLKKGAKIVPQEKIVEKVVYKDRIVESSEKINALQRELAAAQAKLANLKTSPSNTVVKEKIVEKVVYKERPVIQEKVVEKVVYKDRPVVQEKIVEKVVVKNNDATEKLNRALEQKLAENEAQIAKLKAASHKLVAPKTTKLTASSVAVAEKPKTLKAQEVKTAAAPAATTTKKGGSSAYRISGNAPIYNAPGGSQVDTWEDRRSFTAGNPSGGWVHITGYFVNRVWQPTAPGENLYVRESDVIRR